MAPSFLTCSIHSYSIAPLSVTGLSSWGLVVYALPLEIACPLHYDFISLL